MAWLRIQLQQSLSQLEIRTQYYCPLYFLATSFSEGNVLITQLESNEHSHAGIFRKPLTAALELLRRQMPGKTGCKVSTTKVFLLAQQAWPMSHL